MTFIMKESSEKTKEYLLKDLEEKYNFDKEKWQSERNKNVLWEDVNILNNITYEKVLNEIKTVIARLSCEDRDKNKETIEFLNELILSRERAKVIRNGL